MKPLFQTDIRWGIAITGLITATFSDTQAVVTPEPGPMVLLGVALIVVAVLPLLRRVARSLTAAISSRTSGHPPAGRARPAPRPPSRSR